MPEVIAAVRKCSLTSPTSGWRCPRPATRLVAVGCVHEHVRKGRVCEQHLASIEKGRTTCKMCATCDDPHECALLGREVKP